MSYRVILHRNVLKSLKQAPDSIKQRFYEFVEELRFNPIPSERFDIKKLKGRKNTFRVRLGGYRVIYELEKDELLILIIKFGKRENVYE
ncbi:addiction module toxin RelE [Thermococcus profundus]|uniref:Addiction module toxin RelE n=1 Tax=Thermococcus profundus TaxID=49899 RepID=A0A2Z2MAV9_THEPR|nr:type II toxin-antitoxin system RelE/ParE family toxin [Thermococcus profundus]ASJ02593.1 addiction module toxin RelE [Thermococcus profundus]